MKATDELRDAWEAWQRRPLPRIADDEELDEMWSELEYYDAAVAGVVDSVIAVSQPTYLKTVGPDAELRARITARLEDPDATTVRDAQTLLAYLDDLEALLALAQRTHEETQPKRSRR